MAAAVVPSSRDTLDWAAQQDTPTLNVDDVELGPDSVEINPQVYLALAELLEGEALDIVQNTTRGAGLESWRKLVRRFDPQTVGRKRTLLSCHEPLNSGKNVSDRISREREKNSDDVRSGILTEMFPEHIKTHIHLNLTRLPDFASDRSEIETFLEARQSSSNPDAMDIGSLNGLDSEVIGRQVVPNVARVVARVMAGQGKKGKSSKGNNYERQVKQRRK